MTNGTHCILRCDADGSDLTTLADPAVVQAIIDLVHTRVRGLPLRS